MELTKNLENVTTEKAFIEGRVQMVMFRDFAQRKARSFDLVGWVKNLPDGSVEVVAQGEPDTLKQYIEALQSDGQYWFLLGEAKQSLGLSESALTKALWRMNQKHAICRIRKDFYVIVPL